MQSQLVSRIFIAFELKIKVVLSPALQSRSNLLLAFAVKAQFAAARMSQRWHDIQRRVNNWGSVQLPYSCSTD
jgi:hypothetical protein